MKYVVIGLLIVLAVAVLLLLQKKLSTHDISAKTIVIRVFILDTSGKLLLVRYGEMHPSQQWTVPSGFVSTEEYAKNIESAVGRIALQTTGLSVSNVRPLLAAAQGAQTTGFKNFVAYATDDRVTLPEDHVSNYSEYMWVPESEVEQKNPSDLYLTTAQKDMIFMKQ
jgi:ADP-ribose pyrophosphatase YjhB (NUDIX family)